MLEDSVESNMAAKTSSPCYETESFLRLLFRLDKRSHSLGLFCPVHRLHPSTPVLRKYLDLGLQHRIVQTMIINDPSSHEPSPGRDGTSAEHERPTRLAKRIGHGFARRGRLVLRKDGEVVFTSYETGVGVERGKVGREH